MLSKSRLAELVGRSANVKETGQLDPRFIHGRDCSCVLRTGTVKVLERELCNGAEAPVERYACNCRGQNVRRHECEVGNADHSDDDGEPTTAIPGAAQRIALLLPGRAAPVAQL